MIADFFVVQIRLALFVTEKGHVVLSPFKKNHKKNPPVSGGAAGSLWFLFTQKCILK
ncbi:hypothetical protein ABNB80_06250 [Paenibacillus larvae]